ncbi:MAG: hypothetical protein ACXWP4_10450 [Polyangiales bacterium]
MKCLAVAIATLASLACGELAREGELEVDLGYSVRKSTWRGDWTTGGQLGGGYRFARVLSVDFAVWEELARVDDRVNTGLTFGVTGVLPLEKVRPTLRAYFIHQHEEGLVSVEDHPFGTIAGIGAGIRHRAGLGGKLGLEIPFSKKKKTEWVANVGLDTTWFPDATLGPSVYFGVTGGIGLRYALEELP